jgi:hypothetical protein
MALGVVPGSAWSILVQLIVYARSKKVAIGYLAARCSSHEVTERTRIAMG